MELHWKNKDKSIFIDYMDHNKIQWVPKNSPLMHEQRSLVNFAENSISYTHDTLTNSFILGDNLFVLNKLIKDFEKVLEENKFKFVYIDPPYNTLNPELSYDDNLDHDEWLSFMYERLERVKQILRPDGVICVQIDDREYARLYLLMIELFGEKNLKTIVVKMSEASGLKMLVAKSGGIPKLKEYLILAKMDGVQGYSFELIPKEQWDPEYNLYIRNLTLDERKRINSFITSDENITEEDIQEVDDICRKLELVNVNKILEEEKITETLKIEFLKNNSWRICRTAASKSIFKLTEEKKSAMKVKQQIFSVLSPKGKLYIVKSDYNAGSIKPRVQILFADEHLAIHLGDLWTDIKTTGLEFEGEINFKNGKKPEKLIKRLIHGTTSTEGDLILDLFSGSGTVLSVAMELKRKFVGIEVNEEIYRLARERLLKKESSLINNGPLKECKINFLKIE